ncbi:MAG: hypothetical protein QOD77_1591 [Thermoplasmata archaeon]|jgi:hypothetical protein|nr:hypothetical protein [Thermoplasmata archaeon]
MTMRRTAWLGAALLAAAVAAPLAGAHSALSTMPLAESHTTPAPAPLPFWLQPEDLAGLESAVAGPAPRPLFGTAGLAGDAPPGDCAQAQANGPVPPIMFCCPTPPNGQPINLPTDGGNAADTDRFVYTDCPFRIYDTNLVGNYYFGNAALAVNPLDEREMVFTSLHSAPTNGPSPRSRVAGYSHTAFTSRDQGVTWQDQPIPNGAGLGEASTVAFDTAGNMYLGYLWHQANGNATTGHASAFCLFKASSPRTESAALASYSGGSCFESRAPTNPITRVHLVDVPHPEPTPPAPANSTPDAPSTAEDVGEFAEPYDPTLERIAAVWHEKAMVPAEGKGDGMAGWIDARFSGTGARDPWTGLTKPIGPCMDASDAVAYDGAVYVVCTVEAGYSARSRARIGDHDLWRIDPLTGNATLVGPTALAGGHPSLSVTDAGYFALVTSRLRTPEEGQGGAEIRAAFSWYGNDWNPIPGDVGGLLNRMLGGKQTFDAGVTAMQLGTYDGSPVAALIYMEWQQPDDGTPAPPAPDPDNPLAFYSLNDYKKAIVTFDSCNFPVAASLLQLGTQVDASNADAYATQPSLFDDQQDGLVRHRQDNGMDVFYFAVNDYGAMQYGAFQPLAAQFCPSPPPPPIPTVPAFPQALTITSPAVTVAGAMVAFAAVSAVTYLMLAKRRTPSYVTTEAK